MNSQAIGTVLGVIGLGQSAVFVSAYFYIRRNMDRMQAHNDEFLATFKETNRSLGEIAQALKKK